MISQGKYIRLGRLFDTQTNRMILSPLDDALLAGPEDGLRDTSKKLREIVKGKANAIMGFPGLFYSNYPELHGTGTILNLTASTTRRAHTRKILISSVEHALTMGMDAVGVHVNISSIYESEMLDIMGRVSMDCQRLGMPLVGIMYPRSEDDGKDNNYLDLKENKPDDYTELVRHCVKVGVELGADIIKTQFTGNVATFKTVIEASCGIPVVIAGGPKVSPRTAITMASMALEAGAAGISFGRNTFNRKDTVQFLLALRDLVHRNVSVNEVLKTYNFSDDD